MFEGQAISPVFEGQTISLVFEETLHGRIWVLSRLITWALLILSLDSCHIRSQRCYRVAEDIK